MKIVSKFSAGSALVFCLALLVLAGCSSKQTARDEPAVMQKIVAAQKQTKTFKKGAFEINVPGPWSVVEHEKKANGVATCAIKSPDGLLTQLTYIPNLSNATSFQNVMLQRHKTSFGFQATQPFSIAVAQQNADGQQYIYNYKDNAWEGFIVSRGIANGSVLVDVQFPTVRKTHLMQFLPDMLASLKVQGQQ